MTVAHAEPAVKTSRRHYALSGQIVLAVALGSVIGHFWPETATQLKPLGDGFIKLAKMMVPPIVFCTIVGGVSALRGKSNLGKTLVKALGLYVALTALALLTGLFAGLLARPGLGLNIDAAALDPSTVQQYTKQVGATGLAAFVLQIIPDTLLSSLTSGDALPALLVASLIAYGVARVGDAAAPFMKVLDAFSRIIEAVFALLVKLAPLGALGATAYTVGTHGLRSIGTLGALIATFYLACAIFVFFVLSVLARLHGFSLWSLLRYIRAELLIVFGTSSIAPAFPGLLAKLERLGCKDTVTGLALATGYSFNLAGTAIYLPLAIVFISQAMNVELSWTRLLALMLLMMFTSKGAVGVTGSGFLALVATLTAMPDVPVAGVAIIVGIDRFMSEARALTSCVCNAVSVIVVAQWEDACDRTVLKRELGARPIRALEPSTTPIR